MMAKVRDPFSLLTLFLAGGALVAYCSAITLFAVYRPGVLIAAVRYPQWAAGITGSRR